MTLKEIYHIIRPMAALRSEEKFTAPPGVYPPAVYLVTAAVVSVVGGVASGFYLWLLVGYSPDNSGGTLVFVFGSCVMSVLSLVLALFWKKRAVFYGLNVFTFITVLLFILSLTKAKSA